MSPITNAERRRRTEQLARTRIARSLPPQPLLRLPELQGQSERRTAYLLDVDGTTVRRWRAGRRISASTARRVAEHLGKTVGEIWFVEGAHDPSR